MHKELKKYKTIKCKEEKIIDLPKTKEKKLK